MSTTIETRNLLDAVRSLWQHEPVVQHLADEVQRLHAVNDMMAVEIAELHEAPLADPADVAEVEDQWPAPQVTAPYPPSFSPADLGVEL